MNCRQHKCITSRKAFQKKCSTDLNEIKIPLCMESVKNEKDISKEEQQLKIDSLLGEVIHWRKLNKKFFCFVFFENDLTFISSCVSQTCLTGIRKEVSYQSPSPSDIGLHICWPFAAKIPPLDFKETNMSHQSNKM